MVDRLSLQGYVDKQLKWAKAHKLPKKQLETWLRNELLRSSLEAATAIALTIGAAYFIPELELAWAEYVRRGMVTGPVEPVGRFTEAAKYAAKPGGHVETLPYWKAKGYVRPDVWAKGFKTGTTALREGVRKGFSLGSWGASSTLRDISPVIAPAIFGLSFALTSEFKNFFDWIKRTVGDPEVIQAADFIENFGPSIRSRTYMQGLSVEDRQNYWKLYNMAREATGMGELKYPYSDLDVKQEGADLQRYEETMQFGKAQQVLTEDEIALSYDALPENVKNSMVSRGIDRTLYVAYMRMKKTGVPQSILDEHFPQFGAEVERLSDQFMTYDDVMNILLDNEISESPDDLPLYDIPPDEIEFPWKTKKHFSYKD